MSIGQRLKELRLEKGLNKRQVAEQLGLPYTTYNNYETGARDVGSDTLKLLSKFYNVSIDYILENEISTSYTPTTIAAHHNGVEWSASELDEIERFKEFIKAKREK